MDGACIHPKLSFPYLQCLTLFCQHTDCSKLVSVPCHSTKWDPKGITHESKCCDVLKGAEIVRETLGKIKPVSVRKGRF